MVKFILVVLAIGTITYATYWFRQQKRLKHINQMTHDELVDAVIHRKISILEVPSEHRESVDHELKLIQDKLDRP